MKIADSQSHRSAGMSANTGPFRASRFKKHSEESSDVVQKPRLKNFGSKFYQHYAYILQEMIEDAGVVVGLGLGRLRAQQQARYTFRNPTFKIYRYHVTVSV